MSFLAPTFLLAAAAVAVPLVLHLFQRRDPRRVAFPAIRYLQRAEREHARSIRFRQLLLLALRVLAVLLLVAAGARLYLRTGSSSHDPTALALVLDNSLSSGLVHEDRRVLDALRMRALESLEAAGPDDRVWVIRAGEPWDVPRPLTPEEARRRVQETVPGWGAGDLVASLRQAASLAAGSRLPAAEIQLLSDLQSSAFPEGERLELPGDLPVIVLLREGDPPANRWVADVRPAGGLPPLPGEPSDLVVRVDAFPPLADSIPIRLVLAGEVRATGSALPGTEVILPVASFGRGAVAGRVEIDPDPLRADDQDYFAFRVQPPSRVHVVEAPAPSRAGGDFPGFLRQGLVVLEDAGRIRRVERSGDAQVVVFAGAVNADVVRDGTPVVCVPPSDPTLLPAFNHGLARLGIPWELDPLPFEVGVEARVRSSDLPLDLTDIRVFRHYRLGSGEGVPARARVRLSDGDPWAVSGNGPRGPYLLLASPLSPEATDLPVRASMIPFLQWGLVAWPAGAAEGRRLTVGDPLPFVDGATAVEAPDGTVQRLDGTPPFPVTRLPGVYRLLRGDTLLDVIAVNAPSSESRLTPLAPSRLRAVVGPGLVTVSEPASWPSEIFTRRKGPEVWRSLLVAALLVLLTESLVAAGGRARASRGSAGTEGPAGSRGQRKEGARARV